MATKEHGIKQEPAGTMLVYDDKNDRFLLSKGTSTGELFTANGLAIPEHDYISIAYDTLFDTLTYNIGGAGGTQVAEIVVTYTDATKTTISTIARTG